MRPALKKGRPIPGIDCSASDRFVRNHPPAGSIGTVRCEDFGHDIRMQAPRGAFIHGCAQTGGLESAVLGHFAEQMEQHLVPFLNEGGVLGGNHERVVAEIPAWSTIPPQQADREGFAFACGLERLDQIAAATAGGEHQQYVAGSNQC